MTVVRCLISTTIALLSLAGCERGEAPAAEKNASTNAAPLLVKHSVRPNVLLIVLDDIAFTDLGSFGSEIPTPNMDALARGGVIYTGFHVSPTCSPTRAMLLSGNDSHLVGLGNMAEELAPNQQGKSGYEGYLNLRVAALPEVLRDAGYHTYMTGKWHLGLTRETSPAARGFEKSFAMLQGGAGAFSNMLPIVGPGKAKYREDGKLLESLPADFYSTRFYTEKMIEYMQANLADDRPFFAYVAYTSPHWPLQAPEESIARHRGKYAEGYDVLVERRLQRLKELGFFAPGVSAYPRLPGEKAWDELSEQEKRVEQRRMEIYAAMVEDLDIYIGRLVIWLKETGQYDNTFIFLMADNGPEGHHLHRGWEPLAKWMAECCDNSLANMGHADSYIWYGPNWGAAGSTPRRMYKGFTSQGGVNAPAFAHFPKRFSGGRVTQAITHVMDVMPTILAVTGVANPDTRFRDRDVLPMAGESMLTMLEGTTDAVHGPEYAMGWELLAKRGLRQGDWKIIYEPFHELREPWPKGIKTNTWQLYNLAEDPGERHDLADNHPEKLRQLIKAWEEYAAQNGVVIPEVSSGY